MTGTAAIPSLTRWGLSADADLVYRCLVMTGPAVEARLVGELGLARGRVRHAVDELAARTAITPGAGPDRDAVWTAAGTAQLLERLRPRPVVTAPRERWRRHVATVVSAGLGDLERAPIRRLTSRAAARARVAQLAAAERYEHLAANTEVVHSGESMAAASPLDRALLARGVTMQVLARLPADGDRRAPVTTVDRVPPGMFRQVPEVPLKVLIFDRRVALLPADPLDFEAGYVETAEPGVVAALCAYFRRLWSGGRDPFRQGVPTIDLTARERALVVLLAAGHTDQSAAAELRLSTRTVAYTLRNLMDRLGVENRFQLALLLGAAGAVPPPMTPSAENRGPR